ncbi:TetR/AcrR family transcriptional regulator [Staphylococcus hominis]|uniref:TetR/AcrR family transcriptional regulator n=1 Tax=Staphylococcus hominis TaxID=1290 RepID=A0A974KYK6_STAHO|nr:MULTISPECIES: TetR/AcrR family transcriptional regulator [Bacillales]MDU6961356.1 TetR/AcrR family transcriptional regulator [Staphylococcus sp.]OFM60357.1 TetR family transcriptional regulator [Staphylococcus sp. HMSC059G05]AYY66369.1 TetR/AcrR family transcriptional regulator [Staphylococcus hominis]EEK11708.1 transcriptional regulator, TetR family [Staphylococcus hominis SK119]EFS20481.1 putative transcriptional regulator, TetR family [Staphylococcus hominis subsp. hominis C80]
MNNQDLRVQRTKKALITTFSDLLETKSFDNITIQDLCEKANVRRSTFYRHFNDKYDLLNHIVGTLIEYFRTLHLPEIDPKDPRQFFNKFMKDILLFISDNKAMVKSVISINIYSEVYQILYNQIYAVVKRQIEFDKQIGQFYIDEFIYGEFLAGGILSVILNWIQYGQQSIDDVSSDIVTMICGAREVHLKLLK